MTKKDYILIAQALNQSLNSLLYASTNKGETKRSLEVISITLGNALKKDNTLFDWNKWDTAIFK